MMISVLLALIVFRLCVTQSAGFKMTHSSSFHKFSKLKLPETLRVELGDRSYPIYINENFLQIKEQLQSHVGSKKVLIVTNTKVASLYLQKIKSLLQTSTDSPSTEIFEVILPDGEEYKNMDTLMAIVDAALEHKLDRHSVMIALGGGVVGESFCKFRFQHMNPFYRSDCLISDARQHCLFTYLVCSFFAHFR